MREARLTRLQQGLIVVSVALALALVWVLVSSGAPPAAAGADASPPRVAPLDPPAAPETTDGPSASDPLVSGNPFSPRRRPPAGAWWPGVDTAAVADTEPPASPLRLVGTVVDGTVESSFAVIEADPRRPGPELYRVGEAVGEYRLVRIFYEKVVLSREGEVLELPLIQESAAGEGDVARRP